MRIKKIMSLICLIAILISIEPCAVVSAREESQSAIITSESIYAKPGKVVEMDVSIKDNPGILGAALNLSFDDKKITLVKAENGEAFSALVMTQPGKYTGNNVFNWDGQDIANSDVKDGVILKLYFKIADDVKVGDIINVNITYEPMDIVNRDLKEVKLNIENSSINILN